MDKLSGAVQRNYPLAFYLLMRAIPVTGPVDEDTELIRAYLGEDPDAPYFGQILAVLRHKDRFFQILFNVRHEGQRGCDANRLSEIQELVLKHYQCGSIEMDYVERVETDFGHKAFWYYTPDDALDRDALALRAVAKKLKSYSVANGLCAKLRTLEK